ncbi:MAG TPA: hypothetical protein VFW45_14040 [Candidatus Polarisedimenticolia bacterium]|nr:hypothetical protein [Candidatus Polarisedimenticolia bacterium]
MTHARLRRITTAVVALLAGAAPLLAANDYQIDLVIDPAKGTLHGTEKVTYRNETEAPLDTVFLEAPALPAAAGAAAAERWKILSLVDSKGGRAAPEWKPEEQAYAVRLPSPLGPGFKTVFTVEYERPIDTADMAPGYLDLNDRGASSWFPKFRAYRAGSLGSDDLKDVTVNVGAPPGWTVAGSGAAAPGKGGGRTTLTAKSTRNFALAAGEKLKPLRGSAGTIPVLVVAPEGKDAWSRQALAETTEAITFYQGFLGAFPPAQVTVLPAAPFQVKGESSSQVIYAPAGEAALRDAVALQAARLIWGWSVGDPSDATPFVSDGMSIWCQQNYLAKKNQTDLHTQYLRSGINDTYLAGVLRGVDTTLMRARADRSKGETGMDRAIAQAKAGAVMHMLGGILGEEKLQEVARGILKTTRQGFVTDRDFQKAAQAASTARLDGFFDQWLRTKDHLDYYMSRVRGAKAGEGYEARADVYKTGSAAMPVEVVATDLSGTKVRAIFPADRTSGEIVIPLKAPLASMALDPLQRLPLIARIGPAGRSDLAESLMVEGKLLRADEQIDQALGDDPDNPRAWFLKGRLLKERGDWSGALLAWDKVSRMQIPQDDPARIWSQLWTARVYDLQGKRTEAVSIYTALSSLPDARGSQAAAAAGAKAPFTDSWPPLVP